MSTVNFIKNNVNYYYVVFDDKFNYKIDKIKKLLLKNGYLEYSKLINNSSYNREVFARKTVITKDKILSFDIFAIVNYGYYSDANLDYDLKFYVFDESGEYDYLPSFDDVLGDFKYNFSNFDEERYEYVLDRETIKRFFGTSSVEKIINNSLKELENKLDKEIELLEKIYFNNTVVYDLEGVFSNGEGVFKKIKK